MPNGPHGKRGKSKKVIVKEVMVAKAPKKSRNTKFSLRNLGGQLGSHFGPIGSLIGAAAGGAISHVTGRGSYKVSRNSLTSNPGNLSTQAPTFSRRGDDIVVSHRELISDVTSSISYVNAPYYVNPGNSVIFPWLSIIAGAFTEYEFLGLLFVFKPTAGDAVSSTNNALGTVIISSDYDVANPLATSKVIQESNEFTTDCKPSEGMIHPVECAKSGNVLARSYVTKALTPGALSASLDPRMYYLCATQVGRVGMQANSIVVGELWVSYEVVLSRPTLLTTFSGLRTNQQSWYNHHTVYELGADGGALGSGSAAGETPYCKTIAGITPVVDCALHQAIQIYGIGRDETITDYASVLNGLTQIPPASPAGVYCVAWSQHISSPSGFVSGPTKYQETTVNYTDAPTFTNIPANVDDNTPYSSTSSYNEMSIIGLTSAVAIGSMEFTYKSSPAFGYNGFAVIPAFYYFIPVGSSTSTLDVRLTYLGPSNTSSYYGSDMAVTNVPDKFADRRIDLSGKDEVEEITPPPLRVCEEDDDFPLKPPSLLDSKTRSKVLSSSSSASSIPINKKG